MNRSEQINELAAALAKAQGAMRPAEKSSINPHFGSSYADLASIVEAARAPLAANGLAWSQSVEVEKDQKSVTVCTLLMHSSGQWLSSAMTSMARDAGPQAIGSVTTYLRRYGLQALVGIAADGDDDAEAASQPARTAKPPARVKPASPASVPAQFEATAPRENASPSREREPGEDDDRQQVSAPPPTEVQALLVDVSAQQSRGALTVVEGRIAALTKEGKISTSDREVLLERVFIARRKLGPSRSELEMKLGEVTTEEEAQRYRAICGKLNLQRLWEETIARVMAKSVVPDESDVPLPDDDVPF